MATTIAINQRLAPFALDALEGYGDEVFLEVKLWNRRAQELASESLYDDGGEEETEVGESPRPDSPAG